MPLALCGTYINLCDEYGGYCCFAEEEGGPEPGFWFVESYDDQTDHRVNCEFDTSNSRLAVLDTAEKSNCVVRYIKDLRK